MFTTETIGVGCPAIGGGVSEGGLPNVLEPKCKTVRDIPFGVRFSIVRVALVGESAVVAMEFSIPVESSFKVDSLFPEYPEPSKREPDQCHVFVMPP